MPEKISILKESGETLNSNIVSIFMIPDTEKKYMITTENAVDPHGLTVLHVSELVDDSLQRVGTDEEWSSIKTIMRAIISGNVGSFQYLPVVENVSASGQYSRDISVSSTAANQMITSYNNGEKNPVNQQVQQEPIQPIQDIGGNNNVNQVQPVAPQTPVAQNMGVVNPGVVNVGTDSAAMAPQELNPGVMPVMPVNPPETSDPNMIPPVGMNPAGEVVPPSMNPVPPVTVDVQNPVPGMEPISGVINPVAAPQESLNVDQTGALPIANNVIPPLPGPDDVVAPVSLGGLENNGMMEPVDNMMPTTGPVVVGDEPFNSVDVSSPIPQGQIIQPTEAEDVMNSLPTGGSFAPDASLDDVVAASQQMFMEGVKNLVQTIQEKVYRELYAKEEELKKKEEELNQREQMLGGMTNSMQNTNPMDMGAQPNPMQVVNNMQPMQPPMSQMMPMGEQQFNPMGGYQQPMMVQASNDNNFNN